jgi:hypothetical protein
MNARLRRRVDLAEEPFLDINVTARFGQKTHVCIGIVYWFYRLTKLSDTLVIVRRQGTGMQTDLSRYKPISLQLFFLCKPHPTSPMVSNKRGASQVHT